MYYIYCYDFFGFRKGKELKRSERYIMTAEGITRKLVIKKVTPEDQTEITCTAFNVKTSTRLKVEGKLNSDNIVH